MHPTGNSMYAIRRLGCLCKYFPVGDAFRYGLLDYVCQTDLSGYTHFEESLSPCTIFYAPRF